jgi:hypothetical protein
VVNRGAPLPRITIQPLRIVAFPTLVFIVKSIEYRRPYASTSPALASPVRAISSNFVRSLGASAAVNTSAAAKTRALCRPRGLSGLRQRGRVAGKAVQELLRAVSDCIIHCARHAARKVSN